MDKPTVYILQQDLPMPNASHSHMDIIGKGEEVVNNGIDYYHKETGHAIHANVVERSPAWFLPKEPAKVKVLGYHHSSRGELGNAGATHWLYLEHSDPKYTFSVQETDNLTLALNGQWLDIPECRQALVDWVRRWKGNSTDEIIIMLETLSQKLKVV